MTPDDLLKHFKTKRAIAAALGLSPQAISIWFREGSVPDGRQAQLQILTRGKLKAHQHAPPRRPTPGSVLRHIA